MSYKKGWELVWRILTCMLLKILPYILFVWTALWYSSHIRALKNILVLTCQDRFGKLALGRTGLLNVNAPQD